MFMLRLYKLCPRYGFLLLKRLKGTKTEVPADVLKKLDAGYAELMKSKSESLLKKHLTEDIYQELRTKRTETSTLLDCIQSGLANHDSGCGIYAPDAEAYEVFADLFDPIIQDYHSGFSKEDKHPETNFGDPCQFTDLDPFKNYIASTRVRCARSLEGFPFNPCMTKEHYDNIEDMLDCSLSSLEGDLEGSFYPLFGMNKSVKQKLIDDHFLFKEGDRFLKAAQSCRFWPVGRAIYHNYDKTFLVWCNEEDHVRIISMQRGGNFQEVFSRLIRGIKALESQIEFSRHDRLGYLTFCPTNLGTTIRASVHIRVPRLAANPTKLKDIANKFKLQVRGTRGEHTEAEGGIYDISNKRRLGLTEFDAVNELYLGITEIIKLEKAEEARARKKVKKQAKIEPKKTETNAKAEKQTDTGLPPCAMEAKPAAKPTNTPVSQTTNTANKPVAKTVAKQAAKPAPKQPAPKQPAPKQPAPKQPAAKRPAAKRPATKQLVKPVLKTYTKTLVTKPVLKTYTKTLVTKPVIKTYTNTLVTKPVIKTYTKTLVTKPAARPALKMYEKPADIKPPSNSATQTAAKESMRKCTRLQVIMKPVAKFE